MTKEKLRELRRLTYMRMPSESGSWVVTLKEDDLEELLNIVEAAHHFITVVTSIEGNENK